MEFHRDYAPVNELKLYYEIHGIFDPSIPPLVLLHGGGDTIQTSFGHVLSGLSRNRQVIAFEQEGFGHTADTRDLPYSFEQAADDMAALLQYLHVEQADVFGFSSGGTIALQAAIRHPHLVRKLVIASTFFRRDGGDPAFWSMFERVQLNDVPQELRDAYLAVAPHPEDMEKSFQKAAQRMRDFKDIPDESIRAIQSPALIIAGDRDIVHPEHVVEQYRFIPNSRLAILPDTDHMAVMSRTAWLVPVVNSFLEAPML